MVVSDITECSHTKLVGWGTVIVQCFGVSSLESNTWVEIMVVSLTSCVTMSKLLSLFVPLYFHL